MSRKSVVEKFQNESYDIQVTGRNVMVTDAMKNYAIEKISKIDRFNCRITDVSIVMDIQKMEHRVDIVVKVGQLVIKSSANSDDMYASIDKATDRLQSQLRRYKERISDHQLKNGASIDINVNIIGEPQDKELQEVNDDIESESSAQMIGQYGTHKIVSKETKLLKTLNYAEAIMKMELSGDLFMVFRSEEDQKLKVIYRRNDGHFGIIEPEK